MKNRKWMDALLIILAVAAVVLTAMPNCVVMHFMEDPAVGGTYDVYVSGFDMLAVGYAIWGPLAAGVSAALLAVLGIIGTIRESNSLRNWMRGFAVFGLVMSLTPALFQSMTVIGWIISALLLAQAVLLFCRKKRI